MMTLDALLRDLPAARVTGSRQRPIAAVAYHSQAVRSGALFVAIAGRQHDGHAFVAEAVARGAAAVVVERPVDAPAGVAQVLVPDSRLALALLSCAFFRHPSRDLTLIGVTGTNGKGTTAYLLEAMLARAGRPVGIIGTMGVKIGAQTTALERTTPEAADLQRILRQMADGGVRYAIMEVASHALVLHRVAGCQFRGAVFTNLTQDHLDFHQTLDAYRGAKRALFEMVDPAGVAVVNADDPSGAVMAAATRARVVTYGTGARGDLRAEDIELHLDGTGFTVVAGLERRALRLRLHGRFNVYNALAATATARALDVPLDVIEWALAEFGGVPGRFEAVHEGQPFGVIVDYAHTPDGLENVLGAVRDFASGRTLAVFGCGGDRDRTKRPIMGRIAARLADVAIVTSDNPRSEEPQAIIEEILAGTGDQGPGTRRARIEVEPDRRRAIDRAIELARPGDVVVIAGKGHEPYQEINGVKHPFDDRVVAREALRNLRAPGAERKAPMRLTLKEIVTATGGVIVSRPGARSPEPVISGVSTDTRTLRPGDLFIPLRGPSVDGHGFIADAFAKGAAASLAAHPVPAPAGATVILVENPLRALGQIAAAYRRTLPVDVVGVTGSVGKTTTTAMCTAILATHFRVVRTRDDWNAEVGVPLTLLALQPEDQVAVVEMGMRGLGQIAELVAIARPRIGVVTTIGESHLELLESIENVARAKGELIEGLPPDGVSVLNADDPRVRALSARSRARVVSYGLHETADVWGGDIAFVASGMRFMLRHQGNGVAVTLPAWGRHNVRNALAAAAVGLAMGLDLTDVASGLGRFEMPKMRLQTVHAGDVLILNDAYNASPASLAAALDVLKEVSRNRRRVVVLGEVKELGAASGRMHHDMGTEAARVADVLVAVGGPDAGQLVEGALRAKNRGHVHHVPGIAQATALLKQLLQPGDVVLVKGSRAMEMERIVTAIGGIRGSTPEARSV